MPTLDTGFLVMTKQKKKTIKLDLIKIKMCEPGTVAHACNSSTWEKEAGGWGVKGCPWIQIKFEANLDYVKPVLKKKINFHASRTTWRL